MPRKPKPTPDDPAQSERFVEAAKQLAPEATGDEFAKAFKKLVPKKKRKGIK